MPRGLLSEKPEHRARDSEALDIAGIRVDVEAPPPATQVSFTAI
jgi:hypothetical protein